jgi:hypothetical protein
VDYVQRCFDQCLRDEALRSAVERELSEFILSKSADGQVYSIDWARQPPPPSLLRAQAQHAAARHAQAAAARAAAPSPLAATGASPRGASEGFGSSAVAGAGKREKRKGAQKAETANAKRARRAAEASAAAAAAAASSEFDEAELARLESRAQRFRERERERERGRRSGPMPMPTPTPTPGAQASGEEDVALDWSALKIVGQCEEWEKQYLRLTTAPDPALVRPPRVIEIALARVLERWAREGAADYHWTASQFKSMRQDLTVQHIKSDLTVRVYEAHARIALEAGDLSEFNQCQTQLFMLYRDWPALAACEREFMFYHLLYCVVTGNAAALTKAIAELPRAAREDAAIALALSLRQAVALNNYCVFFRLHARCPLHGRYLTAKLVPRIRLRALAVMLRAYRPGAVQIRFVATSLGFGEDVEACRRYVVACGAALSEDGDALNTVASGAIREPEEVAAPQTARGVTHAIV